LAWKDTVALYKLPQSSESTFQPWEKASENVVTSIRAMVKDAFFWEELAKYYSEESDAEVVEVVTQDNASCVKSICRSHFRSGFQPFMPSPPVQLLEDEPFDALKPTLEDLLSSKEKSEQRAAADLLAGLLGGKFTSLLTFSHSPRGSI
jgi:proteasome activator subunit 4